MGKMADAVKSAAEMTKKLDKEIKAIQGRTMKGLIRAAIVIRRDMDKTSPTIPIDTGNLRQSYVTNTFYEGLNPFVEMQFTASYAAYVHEMVGGRSGYGKPNFQRPGSGAKFFEAALKRNEGEVLKIIQEDARIK